MIGRTISHYKIVDKLGEGGMGAVYKAEDTTLNRLVAIKALSSHLAENDEARERFVREAQAASSLNHSNITTVHELLEDEGEQFIVMEYVDGKTIRDMVESSHVSIRKALDIIIQAAKALDAAHNKGILHRDVKSANIMVNMEGRVKVMDFGLAHLEERSQLTRTGTTMGTLSYSSPEQISGRTVDRRSEIFSLGVVFYELLTGQLPFKASNEAAILYAIVNDDPPWVYELRDDVPELVEAVVSRMLEKDSDLRYQTCADVIQDLQGIRREMETSTVGITGLLERVRSNRKRDVAMRLGTGIVAIAALAIVAIALLTPGRGTLLLRDRVLVIPFENETGDSSLDQIGKATADWLARGLQETGIVEVIDFRTALLASGVGELESTQQVTVGLVGTIAEETGCGTVVWGRYYLLADSLNYEARISNIVTGQLIRQIGPESTARNDPLQAVLPLSEHVMGALASFVDPAFGEIAPATRHLPNYAAYREYILGDDAFARLDFEAALGHFSVAINRDPQFMLAYIRVAYAMINLNLHAQVDSIGRVLTGERHTLNTYEEHYLERVLAWTRGDYEAAYRAAKGMYELIPKSGYIAYLAGRSAISVNRPREAGAILETLDPSIAPLSLRPAYYEDYTIALNMLGEHQRELSVADKGFAQHQNQMTLLFLIRAQAALGNLDEVNKLLDMSIGLPSNNRYPFVRLLLKALIELRAHGHTQAVQAIVDRSLNWHRTQPLTGEKYQRAQLLYACEYWSEARDLLLELEAGNPEAYEYWGWLGLCVARLGNQDEAKEYSRRLEELDRPYLQGAHTLYMARIAAVLGEQDQVMRLLQNAISQGRDYRGAFFHRDFDFESLRDYPAFQELIRPKG